MQEIDAGEVVQLLMEARAKRTPAEAPGLLSGGISADTAYAVQRLHCDAILARHGGTLIGTKLGGGNMAAMAALGLTGPFRGPIFSAFMHDSPARLRREDFLVCIVEAEVGLLINRDLGGHPYMLPRDALESAIEAVIPSIEIADARLVDFARRPAAAILADLAYAGAWVRGAAVTDWAGVDWRTLEVRLLSNGSQVRSATGSLALGDPLQALSVMVADLGHSGEKLKAGQVVSTGTYTMPYLASAGETIVADFGALGKVEVVLD